MKTTIKKFFILPMMATLFVWIANMSNAHAADYKTDTIIVNGNCGMCKQRIINAVTVKGVKSANWNEETQQLTISYNPAKVTLDELEQRIAKVGHDTPNYKAPDEVYNALHGCCQYPREK
ncbi:MAG: cation transporter [Chitinophagales bacterium]|nr:cation transporter [Chitinophagales bacterium]MCZ2394126.1 cation transporter [Chitinophagales bacterium]